MDLSDFLEEERISNIHIPEYSFSYYPVREDEREDEKSNGDRSVYINRDLIYSTHYIDAIKSLGESRICTKKIIDSARVMLEHHHGDKYEDLYFIDSITNQRLARTDYRVREQEVMPTEAMKKMTLGNPNIISIHNHPSDSLPSFADILTCQKIGYKYGLIVCHSGTIYQYRCADIVNKAIYNSAYTKFYIRENNLYLKYKNRYICENNFKRIHQTNISKFSSECADIGILFSEILWNNSIKI